MNDTNQQLSIMIAYEKAEDRARLEPLMTQAHAKFYWCQTGADALVLWHDKSIDLLLVTETLTDMTGIALCEQARGSAKGHHLPIVFLLDEIRPDYIAEIYEAKATDYWLLSDESTLQHRYQFCLQACGYVQSHWHLSEQLSELLQNASNEIIAFSANAYKILQANLGACANLGYTFDELQSNSFLAFIPETDHGAFQSAVSNLIEHQKKVVVFNSHLKRKDGTEYPSEISLYFSRHGERKMVVAIILDVTEREHQDELIRNLAFFDALTQLPNRTLFSIELSKAIAAAKRNRKHLALLLVDLDQFKRVNNTLGQAFGDQLLGMIADRLKECVCATDQVGVTNTDQYGIGRQCGDEFSIYFSDIENTQSILTVINRIVHTLSEPFFIDNHHVVMTQSIGVALYPTDGDTFEDLLKSANAAVTYAKSLGGDTHQFFADSMNETSQEHLLLESKIREALDKNEFELFYQPQVDCQTGLIIGLEALIRWTRPDGETISPGKFIPVAEETGLIVPIGDWVIKTACRQMQSWNNRGLKPVKVSINLCATQLRKHRIFNSLDDALAETKVDPAFLQLEVTESSIMENVEEGINMLTSLKSRGVTISIDDFGTGYSSLSYIQQFPVDALKIDQSFIHNCVNSKGDRAIVIAIISMAKNLGLDLVVEGVETRAQLEFVKTQGATVIQGFYYSRAIDVATLEQLFDSPFN